MKLGVIDYGASNIFSVVRALNSLGASTKIVKTPEDFKNTDKLVFPGQGSMGACSKKLSENNLTNNRVPIAAIIYDYKNQKIIARATNTNSPIGHAELEAIREALEIKKTNRLDDCDIYVTIEPCLMCATAISKCHMRRIYFGAEDKLSLIHISEPTRPY